VTFLRPPKSGAVAGVPGVESAGIRPVPGDSIGECMVAAFGRWRHHDECEAHKRWPCWPPHRSGPSAAAQLTKEKELDPTKNARTRRPSRSGRSRAATGLTAALLGLVALTGCGDSGSGTHESTPSAPTSVTATGNVEVVVKNYTFTPTNVSIPVGATITWKFEDSVQHNVTASDQSFKSADLSSGQTFAMTFTKSGTFPYTCTIHPYMTGTITVR